ncbi:HAD family hydrolase [Nocardioides nitrophenolicus]|uniref:HAD family hydrolase n=1 Tax=Nocardioides nitrophenolicus TaxID=60489 RepID=UPI001959ABC6|nr:HAD family hydrolase [Nocardioides nitrophenolicus]MBM7516802.1 2-haloacid dehalogenase [Nocardioides nitrophenolicus]
MTTARGWLTFDCYGTLVDWRSGMESALARVDPARVDDLLAGYHRAEPALQQQRPLLSYREVLRDGLLASAGELGIDVPDGLDTVLADTMPTWQPFAETAEVLQALRAAGWRLAILSNVDDDVIAQTLELLGAPIDVVVTAQEVGSYKPGLAHFEEFRRRAQPAEGRWIHVACSWVHDVVPARRLGVPAVFVDREGEDRDPAQVVGVLPDLTRLPDTLASLDL